MATWAKYPVIYEINTWVWLYELGKKYNRLVTLATVPSEEWNNLSNLAVDAVWLMGVWTRSSAGIAISNQDKGLCDDFRRALPDFQPEDNIGSAYCVRQYIVDAHLGGTEGLAITRNELARRGLKLILDFVPNHVAQDHPWALSHPEYFVQGNASEARNFPASFVQVHGRVFACGKDPYFPAWADVLQLNAFQEELRQAAIKTLSDIASQCDGVRCDMAMLMLNKVFAHTWKGRVGETPESDYWTKVIPAIKGKQQDFKFIAEAYWGLEWELQRQGFDYCYDKRLYDRLEHDTAESIRLHLCADPGYQDKLIRFIENHDEPRALQAFSAPKERAAAVIMATIPGAKLFHEGQFEGMTVKLPVFLRRRPIEAVNQDLLAFYQRLLKAIDNDVLRNGQWQLCERSGWPDNQSYLNVLSWCWVKNDARYLIAVNFSDGAAQALVHVAMNDLIGKTCRLNDVMNDKVYDRSGSEMVNPGLYVALGPWDVHFFCLGLNHLCNVPLLKDGIRRLKI